MKIRTDFVTNSSSSSFVAWLQLSFDNGKKIRLLEADKHDGGEEGGFIDVPDTHYSVDTSVWGSYEKTFGGTFIRKIARGDIDLQGLVSLLEKELRESREEILLFSKEKEDIFRGAKRIQSGKLTLWAHTYGEYYSEADPQDLIEKYSIFDLQDCEDSDSYDSVYLALQNHPDAHLYTEKSLQRIAKAISASWDEHGSDTVITQTLTENGLIEVEIQTDDGGIIPVEDAWEMMTSANKKKKAEYDIDKRLAKYGLSKAGIRNEVKELYDKYKSLIDHHVPIEIAGKKFCLIREFGYGNLYGADRIIEKLGGLSAVSFDESADYTVLDIKEDADLDLIGRKYDELASEIDFCERHPTIKLITGERLLAEIHQQEALYKQRLYQQIIDKDTAIAFSGKHFVFDCIEYNENKYINIIKSKGGIIHGSAVKAADYLVIGSSLGFDFSKKITNTFEWREKGSKVKIVTLEDVKKVLDDPALLAEMEKRLQTEEDEAQKAEEIKRQQLSVELQRQKEERRKQKQQERQEKQDELRQQQIEERQKKTEIQQKIKEEKIKEKERLAAEAKAQKERDRQEAIANATILYAPGQEPDKIHRRIQTLCSKLDGAYPDRVISGLYSDHKKWAETVTELRRLLGYVDNTAFLEAYGYTVVVSDIKGGKPASTDPVAITQELRRRYPDGTGNLSISQLKEANTDIPWKTLTNNSREYFGVTLAAYLKKLHTIDISSIKSPITTTEEAQKTDTTTRVSTPTSIQEAPATDHEPESIEQQCLEVISTLCENLTEAPADMVAAVSGCSEAELSKAIERLVSDGKIVRTETGHLRPVIIQDIPAKDEPKEVPDEQPSMSVPVVSQPEEESDEPDSSGTTEFQDKEETDASLPADDTNELTETDKKYLAAILHLGQSGAAVKAIDIAAYLNVTKASVSYAMKRLGNKGYIYYGDDKAIHLADGIDESLLSSTEAMVIDSSLAVELSDSEKKYIWAIEQLQKKNGFVRAIDIADLLEVTKPSVSYSIKKLREKGAVAQLPNGSLAIVTADYPPAASNEGTVMTEAAQTSHNQSAEQKTIETEALNVVASQDSFTDISDHDTADDATETLATGMQQVTESEAQVVAETTDQIQTADAKAAPSETEKQAQVENEAQKLRIAEEKARHDAEEQQRQAAEAQARREAEEKARREAIEQAKRDAEATAKKAEEAKKAAEKARISAEILSLTNEMNSLRGLFAGLKRKKLQARIDELYEQLRRL